MGSTRRPGWQPERDLPLPVFPAENVKIVVSARLLVDRDAEGWIEALQWHGTASRFELPPLDREGVAEVLRSVTAAEEWTPAEKVADTLQEATEGDPLLVRLFVDAIGPQGFIDPGGSPSSSPAALRTTSISGGEPSARLGRTKVAIPSWRRSSRTQSSASSPPC